MRATFATWLTDLIYPPRCIACPNETSLPNGLCASCWAETEFISGAICDCCGLPVEGVGENLRCDACASFPPPWQRGRSAVVYGGIGRRVVLQLKHGDRLDIVPALSAWMRRAGQHLIESADIIAPVPLHWQRLLKRKYNQSAVLAQAINLQKTVPDLLLRARKTVPLDGKSRFERAELLNGAITISKIHIEKVKGAKVLLVDDVLTTGATLTSCTDILLANGAENVNVLTLARVAHSALPPISKGEKESSNAAN